MLAELHHVKKQYGDFSLEDRAIRKARAGGLKDEEICELFQLIMEE